MNDSFAPCFHADVAAALADAKLDWVGSANLIENFPELTLTPEQRAVTQRLDDPLLRELVKDMCLERSLRHDVFVRGARRITRQARDAALMDVCIWRSTSARGNAVRGRHVRPARPRSTAASTARSPQAMATGPRRVGDLLALPGPGGRRDNPAELVGMLVGLDLAEPALRGRVPSRRRRRCASTASTLANLRPDREPRPPDRRREPCAGYRRAVHAVRSLRDRPPPGRRGRSPDGCLDKRSGEQPGREWSGPTA